MDNKIYTVLKYRNTQNDSKAYSLSPEHSPLFLFLKHLNILKRCRHIEIFKLLIPFKGYTVEISAYFFQREFPLSL